MMRAREHRPYFGSAASVILLFTLGVLAGVFLAPLIPTQRSTRLQTLGHGAPGGNLQDRDFWDGASPGVDKSDALASKPPKADDRDTPKATQSALTPQATMKPRLPGENPYSFAGTSDDPFWRQYDPSTHADRFWKRQVTHGLAPAWNLPPRRPLVYRDASKDAGEVDHEDYALTRELVEKYATKDGFIMVTFANSHYLDFVLNWVEHLDAVGVKEYVVGAMDTDLLSELVARGINCFSMDTGLTKNDFGWGSASFHRMGREKVQLVEIFTRMGFNMLISDVDTVWLRDFREFLPVCPECDLLASSDCLTTTTKDKEDMLESFDRCGGPANIGIMYFKPSANGFAKEWLDMVLEDDNYWDQNAFNDLFRRSPKEEGSKFGWRNHDSGDRSFMAYGGHIRMGLLPSSMFANGHTFYLQRMYAEHGVKPYVVHNTFQYAGTEGKRHRFREMLLWDDPPSYFDDPEGFIFFRPDVPEELLEKSGPVKTNSLLPEETIGHFNLVHYQLYQVRSAFAIAQMTDRVLIMPPVWCGLDRSWFGHFGVMPGSDLKLPFLCPMDHVFGVEDWVNNRFSEEVGGRPVKFREYSFLLNSRVSEDLWPGRVTIEPCFEEGCTSGLDTASQGSTVKLEAGLDGEDISRMLKDLSGIKLWEFTSMVGVFGRFRDSVKQQQMEVRFKGGVALWCCMPEKHPGHIWYDPLFDEWPHRDRHNRLIDGPFDASLLGP